MAGQETLTKSASALHWARRRSGHDAQGRLVMRAHRLTVFRKNGGAMIKAYGEVGDGGRVRHHHRLYSPHGFSAQIAGA